MLYIAAFVSMYSMRCTDSVLPALSVAFGTTPSDVAVVISAFALGYGLFQLIVGPFGERYHRISVVTAGTFCCTLTALFCLLSRSLLWLRVCRFASGATAACIVPSAMAWIGDHIPYVHRQETLARLLCATLSGMISGQYVGALVTEQFGWRSSFLLLGLLFTIVTVSLGFRGGLTSGSSIVTPRESWLSSLVAVLARSRARRLLAIVLAEGAVGFGAMAFVPVYLHARFGLSMTTAGAVLVFFGLGGLLYVSCARHLLRRLKEKHLAILGGSSFAFGVISLASIAHWKLAIATCALMGFGFYTIHGTLQTRATQMAPTARGIAMSLFSCVLFFGQSVGITAVARLTDRYPTPWVFSFAGVSFLLLSGVFAWLLASQDAAAPDLNTACLRN